MRFTITQKLTLTILLFVSAGTAIVLLLILPAMSSIQKTTESMVAQMASEDKELERLRLLRRSLTEIDQIDQDISKIDAISISRADEHDIIERLETLAQEHGVDQQLSVSYTAEGGSPEFSGYYLFHFSTRGTFAQVRSYLADLEQLPYYFIIPKITVEKNNDSASTDSTVLIQFSAILNSTSS